MSFASYCENPARGYNSIGVMEVLAPEGNFSGSTRLRKNWTAKAQPTQTERCPFVLPALTQKITSLQMSFKLSGVGFSAGVIPALYLEKLSPSGAPATIGMLVAATSALQTYQFNLDSTFPVVQATEKGDILRLKIVIPVGPPTAMVTMSDITVSIPSGSSGIPPVRLPFEESLERNGNEQSLEMRSYRNWTIRPGTRGWTNTAQLTLKPTAIIVDMQVELCALPATAGPPGAIAGSGKGNNRGNNAICLQLVRMGDMVPTSLVIYDSGVNPMLGTKTSVHFEIDLKKGGGVGVDPAAKKLITFFKSGDCYQLETQQLHPQTTMKISRFMMRISTDNSRGGNLAHSLIHQSKLLTLAGNHSAVGPSQEDEEGENAFGGDEDKRGGFQTLIDEQINRRPEYEDERDREDGWFSALYDNYCLNRDDGYGNGYGDSGGDGGGGGGLGFNFGGGDWGGGGDAGGGGGGGFDWGGLGGLGGGGDGGGFDFGGGDWGGGNLSL
jgi:hypothetical protein